MRNAKISLDGAVDPCLKDHGNIVFKLDKNNETEVELDARLRDFSRGNRAPS